MDIASKLKIKLVLNLVSMCLRAKKSLVVALVTLAGLYLIFNSYDSWPFTRSVSSGQTNSNSKSWINQVVHVPLPNLLVEKPLLIDASRVKTISAKNLTHIINSSPGYQRNLNALHLESQSDRKKRLDFYCRKYGLKNKIISTWRKSSNIYKGKQRYCTTKNCPMLIDEKNKFLMCFVQKVASTSIKEYFSILMGKQFNHTSHFNITAFHLEANDQLTRVSPMFYSTKQLNSDYFKSIFVRHPFLRLISAFKDKAERSRSEEPYFYDKYWDKIMREVRGDHNVNNDSRPVFKEFVRLLLTTNPFQYDEHWAPYWTRCEPCFIQYDFIGKLETSERDFKFIANKHKTNQIIWENKNFSPKSANKEAKKYLLQISPQEIIDLYKKYYLDFKLFGYTIEEIFH